MIDRSLNYGRHNIEAFLGQIAPFDTIVDVGAGTGTDLDIASKVSPQSQRFAVETYPPSIEKLRQRHQPLPLNLEVDPLPFADESIDVVMSNQVMEHVKEVFWILHQVSRVLRVDGHMVIGVPNLASLHNRLLLLLGMQPTAIQNHSAHLRGYTRSDFVRMLNRVFPGGYELKNFKGANFYPFPPVIARPLAAAFPNAAWGITMLFKKVKPYHGEFLEFPVKEKLETNFYLGPQKQEEDVATTV